MGKGAVDEKGNSFERKTSTHGMPLGEAGASFEKTIRNLGGDPADPFRIFPEVKEYYRKVLDRKRKEVAELKRIEAEWRLRIRNSRPNLISSSPASHLRLTMHPSPIRKALPRGLLHRNVLSVFAQQVGKHDRRLGRPFEQ
jgi:hypothetical protein